MDRDKITTLYRGSSIDATYQISIHLGKRFQRRFKTNQPIKNNNFLWRPCSLTDRDEISNLYACFLPNFSSFGKAVSKENIFFRNQLIRKQNGLSRPCLLTDYKINEHLYRGPSSDTSYQVLIHLAKRLQRRLFLEINQLERRMACGSHVCSRNGTTLPIFTEDIPQIPPTKFQFIWESGFRGDDFLEINQSKRRMACCGHVCERIETK